MLGNETIRATVIDGYPAEESDELQLEVGEVITVVNNDDTEWWWGKGKYGVGRFPKAFVKIISETSSHQQKMLQSINTGPQMKAIHQSPGNNTVLLPHLDLSSLRIDYLNVNAQRVNFPKS